MKIIIKKLLTYIIKTRNIHKCKFGSSVLLRGACHFEGKNHIGNRSLFYNSSMGYASYMGDQNVFVNVKIGKYCSLGSDIAVVASTHPLNNMVSTHPSFYSCDYSHFSYVKKTKFNEILLTEEGTECSIGSDVWIGNHVRIKGGVTIGNGAVIGMGSIVTKDVPPYAIVAGSPAKIIKYRFDADKIEILQKYKWWNCSEEWLKQHAEEFSDADNFFNSISGVGK